jgi:hypothetical protein
LLLVILLTEDEHINNELSTNNQVWQTVDKLISEIENVNRNLPFTYFFKGLREYFKENYVIAIENFQNCQKFTQK